MIAAQPARTADWLRLVLDSTGEGFYTVDRDGETTLCNAAFLRMLGFADEHEALGASFTTLSKMLLDRSRVSARVLATLPE